MAIYEHGQERDEGHEDEQIEPTQDAADILPVRAQDVPSES